MPDREKVIKGLEYHLKELTVGKTCYECPYFGDNPCENQLIANAIALLKEQEQTIDNLNKTVKELLQHIADIKEYMTPSGKVKDVRAVVELLKEQEGTISELQNAYGYLQKQFFEVQDEMLKEQEAVEPITEHHLFLCPVCKNTLFREQKCCHECGKRIKWEGR